MTKAIPIPQFAFIIGSMKSGTTYLFSLLAQHPEVSACSIKEPEYFVVDYYKNKSIDEYFKLWDFNHDKHKVAIEASTSYTKRPQFANAAETIEASGVNAKFIYLMRDPVKRIESQVAMSRCFGWEVFDKDKNIHSNALSVSMYHFQISEYYKRFPSEDILLLSFEEFTANPKPILKQVCKFLNIDDSFQFHIKKGSVHKSTVYLYQNTPIVKNVFGISSYEAYLNFLANNKDSLKSRLLIWYLSRISKLKQSQIKCINQKLEKDLQKLKTDYGFEIYK